MTLEEIADSLPGTAETMAEVGRAYGGCWHAAVGGNWELSAYFLRRTRGMLRRLGVRRPKYEAQLRAYDDEALAPLLRTIESRDLPAFQAAYRAGIDRANFYHVQTGHAYIRWISPGEPPQGLDLSPGSASDGGD
jgi:hypothetical protein